jgi:hypothetical protein
MDEMTRDNLLATLTQLGPLAGKAIGGPQSLSELGELRRALLDALEAVEDALVPAMIAGSRRGMTYVELANASSYASTTTITKIMRDAGYSPGRGPKAFKERRARAVDVA